MTEPPAVECQRCESRVKITERIPTSSGDRVCKSCATEGEIEEYEDYVDEMEARATAAQERSKLDRGP
jgi:peptide subunit release factor 1 (eRF1)